MITLDEKIVNIHEAKTHLSRLLLAAEQGKKITIARDGEPIARLIPIEKLVLTRKPGLLLGLSVPKDFCDPLPAHEIEAWYH